MDGNTNDRTFKHCNSPLLVNLSTIEPKPLKWLWPGRIPLGKLSIICGEPGLGKSQATLDIASRVTTGDLWPDARSNASKGSVVLLSAEDDLADTIVPRLNAAGAMRHRITAIRGVATDTDDQTAKRRSFSLDRDLPSLVEAIKSFEDTRLVVVDPISAYMGDANSHKDAEVRSVLEPLAELAAEHEVAVVAVMHLNKNNAASALQRITGSMAFVAASRAAWLITQDKENTDRRLFLSVKNNLAKDVGGLAFSIAEGPCLDWEVGAVTITADAALANPEDSRWNPRKRARDFLTELLSEAPCPVKFIEEQAMQKGLSDKTLQRAKTELGIESCREGFGKGSVVKWKLPIDAQHSPVHGKVAIYDDQPL